MVRGIDVAHEFMGIRTYKCNVVVVEIPIYSGHHRPDGLGADSEKSIIKTTLYHLSGDCHFHGEFVSLKILRIFSGVYAHEGEMSAREKEVNDAGSFFYLKSEREVGYFLHHFEKSFSIDSNLSVKTLVGDLHPCCHHCLLIAARDHQGVFPHFKKEIIKNGKGVFRIYHLADSGKLLLKSLSVYVKFHISYIFYYYSIVCRSRPKKRAQLGFLTHKDSKKNSDTQKKVSRSRPA